MATDNISNRGKIRKNEDIPIRQYFRQYKRSGMFSRFGGKQCKMFKMRPSKQNITPRNLSKKRSMTCTKRVDGLPCMPITCESC